VKQRVDYDQIAPTYNRRFASRDRSGTSHALSALARQVHAQRVLEAGCGTGHWLDQLYPQVPGLYGLDLSNGMLHQAQEREAPLRLTRGRARHLPFADRCFDLVFCVNAIHHFNDPYAFIHEAYRALRPNGAIATIGWEPHGRRDSWYVYDYFEGTYERDLERFPHWAEVAGWMQEAGFQQLDRREVRHILDDKHGRSVLDDPFLQKNACSQLALLSDAAYAQGLERIRRDLDLAETRGQTLRFRSELSIEMLRAFKAG
jgi:ubiquinone/menaquinone biosynthesis C-methylase UbiE